MPWELGYFDGHNGNVAILPVVTEPRKAGFRGEEYLGLYPFVDFANVEGTTTYDAWINRSNEQFLRFGEWKTASDKLRPHL